MHDYQKRAALLETLRVNGPFHEVSFGGMERDQRPVPNLNVVDERDYARWHDESHVVRDMFGALLDTPAFNRLGAISFLGILSPRFLRKAQSPLLRRHKYDPSQSDFDGSRRSHSLGVALLALKICRHLRFNETQQRYAVAWGLLHDLGNWPLSHTGEQAFSEHLDVTTKTLRVWLITNDQRGPSKYWAGSALEKSGIDPVRLALLFERKPDPELAVVHTLFRSKLTPDMLEGVWRSGRALDVEVPDPLLFERAFERNLFERILLRPDSVELAKQFWRSKATIYRRFFSARTVAKWESAWCAAIRRVYARSGLSLLQSLELQEAEIIDLVIKSGLRDPDGLYRWKPPVQQRLKRGPIKEMELDCLGGTFIEEPSLIVGSDGTRTRPKAGQD